MPGQTGGNDDETSHTGCTNIRRSIVAAFQRLFHLCLNNGANETSRQARTHMSFSTADETSRQARTRMSFSTADGTSRQARTRMSFSTADETSRQARTRMSCSTADGTSRQARTRMSCSTADEKLPSTIPDDSVTAAGTKIESASTIITYDDSKVSNATYRTPSSRAGYLPRSKSCNQFKWLTEEESPMLDTYCWYPKQWKQNLVDTNKTDSNKHLGDAGNDSIDDHDVINDAFDGVPLYGSDARFMTLELRRRARTMSTVQSMNLQREDCRLRVDGSNQMNTDQAIEGTSRARIRRYMPRISDLDSVCSIHGTVIPSKGERGQRGRLILAIETKGKFIKKRTSVKPMRCGTGVIVTLVPKREVHVPAVCNARHYEAAHYHGLSIHYM